LEEHDRMLVLRHFAEDFKKIGTTSRKNNTVSGEHPPLRAKDNICEGVMSP
jgi:hypothetical protein